MKRLCRNSCERSWELNRRKLYIACGWSGERGSKVGRMNGQNDILPKTKDVQCKAGVGCRIGGNL
jgi:hypothetical protein